MRTSYNKKIYLFLFIIFVFGIGCGLSVLNYIDNEVIINNINSYISNINNNHINFIILHFLIISILFFLSFFIISIPLNIICAFYNGLSIGFIFNAFRITLGLKGIVYSIIYIIVTKFIYIILLFIILNTLSRISIYLFKFYILQKNDIINHNIILYKKALLCSLLLLVNDIFIYYIGNSILNIFSFLI